MPNCPNCIYKLEATKRTIVINKTSPGSGDKFRVGYVQFLTFKEHYAYKSVSQGSQGVHLYKLPFHSFPQLRSFKPKLWGIPI